MDGPLLLPSGQPRDLLLLGAAPPPNRRAPASTSGKHFPAWLRLPLTVLLSFTAGGLAGGLAASLLADDGPARPSATAPVTSVVYSPLAGDRVLPELVAEVSRSVVAIEVTSRTSTGTSGQAITSESSGTGFVLSADGLIATAAHVVQDAVMISVRMPDGSIARGTLVGQDPAADLAVIRVSRKGLVPAVLGSSAALQPGELALVIGNALALEGSLSVSLGIVSATDRTIMTSDGTIYTDLIQVDAAVNTGDSGGPLVNGAGQVVGITTAAVKASVGNNIGFAMPIDIAAPILFELAGLDR